MKLATAVTLLSGVTATGASIPVQLDGESFTVVITGITTATVKVQGSIDGSNWIDVGSVTADGSVSSANAWKHIRANVSAYTAGTITAKIIY